MIRLVKAFVFALVVLLASCTCTAEKGAVSRLQTEHEKFFVKYLKYVDQDPAFGGAALSEEQRKKARDDERKNVQALRDVILSLKKSIGD